MNVLLAQYGYWAMPMSILRARWCRDACGYSQFLRPQLDMGHQTAGFAPDVDDLFQCLGQGLIAHMHVEDTVVAGRDFGERDEFFRGLVLVGVRL